MTEKSAHDVCLSDAFSRALADEIARLKAEGYSKAAICERSFEIEKEVAVRLYGPSSTP